MNFNIFSENFSNIFNGVESKTSQDSKDNENFDKVKSSNKALWRAVILQSIIDILNNSSRTENKIAKLEAKKWIFSDDEDFQYACQMAGYKMEFVRYKVLNIMRKNLKTRVILNTSRVKENKSFLFFQWTDNSSPNIKNTCNYVFN